MAINAEVQKSGNETALATIRKFSRRVQGTGLIRTVRSARYFARDASKTVRKKRALKLLKRRAEYLRKYKEGKIADQPYVRSGRPHAGHVGSHAHTGLPAQAGAPDGKNHANAAAPAGQREQGQARE